MKKIILKNGLTLLLEERKSDSITLQVTVKVGSDNETEANNGISHFVEHMLFEGTQQHKDARSITNEIEKLGGDINAYTSNEKTCYYIKVPKEHFLKALDILFDITTHSRFPARALEKERKVILKEINLHRDEPRSHQWVLFQQLLFKKHPARLPTYGNERAVKSMKRSELFDFYKERYVGGNLIVSAVGDLPSNALAILQSSFGKISRGTVPDKYLPEEPALSKIEVSKEIRSINNSYMVMGYKAPVRVVYDSYVLDVIRSILGRGQSGRIFEEIRNKRGLAYEVGVYHDCGKDFGFFSVYLNTHKRHIREALKVILQEFRKLSKIKPKDLEEAKGNLIGQYILDHEDTQMIADEMAAWEVVGGSEHGNRYLETIKKVSIPDVKRVAQQYLTDHYALALIEQK